MTTDPNQLLLEVTALAREAGRAILEIYASSFSVQEKEDRSPLTEADLRSERLILAGLRRIAPEIPVLSEEAAQVPYSTRKNWSRLWVVDPLDGTREFVQRNGEFTVNIALVDNHRPVLGIVHAPVLERDYYACEGVGAFRSDAEAAGRPIRVAKRGAGPVRVVGSRSHRGSSLDGFLARVGPHEFVEVGSSIEALPRRRRPGGRLSAARAHERMGHRRRAMRARAGRWPGAEARRRAARLQRARGSAQPAFRGHCRFGHRLARDDAMTWGLLLSVAVFAAVAIFWHSSLAARELANRVAQETCASANVQMLDGTVAIHRLRIVRTGDAPLSWNRTYVFDYTADGYSRQRGFVVLTGDNVDTVGLGPRAV